MKINSEIKYACQSIIRRSSNIGRFTKQEFVWLDQAIQWFDNPKEDFYFSFCISLRNNGESKYHSIEFDGTTLTVDTIGSTYDPQFGADHYTSFLLSVSDHEIYEAGDILQWKEYANEALSLFDDDCIKVEITIDVEDE